MQGVLSVMEAQDDAEQLIELREQRRLVVRAVAAAAVGPEQRAVQHLVEVGLVGVDDTVEIIRLADLLEERCPGGTCTVRDHSQK